MRFLLALLALLALSHAHLDWKPKRVHLVDFIPSGPSFLFRGNEPLLKNETTGELYWPFEDFKARLISVAADANVTLPERFHLIDLSLETVLTESDDINGEKNFLSASNSTEAEFWRFSIVGDLSKPTFFPPSILEIMAKSLPTWQVDRLHARLPTVHQALHTKRGFFFLFIFHNLSFRR